MVKSLLYFGHCLRLAGINVSMDQLATALEALGLVGVERQVFRTVLRSIFAKTQQEIAIFEKVFDLCFGATVKQFPSQISLVDSIDGLALKIQASGCDGKGIGRSGVGSSSGDLLTSLLNETELEAMAKTLVESLTWDEATPKAVGVYWEKIKRQIDWHMLHYEVEHRLELKETERLFLKERLDYLALRVEYYLFQRIAFVDGSSGVERLLKELDYQKQDLNDLSETALQMMGQQVKQLGRRLASRKGYRLYPSHRRNKIDLKKTLQLAAIRGGVPLDLKRKDRRLKHPELVVLCDISNSMARYTQFMLLLVWAIQTRHKKIRSFVFVDRLAEVTNLLKGQEALVGLKFIGIYAPCSATGFTDYGRVFADFTQVYLEGISPKAKFLVLGDGKNNWRAPQVDALEAISRRGEGVYWFNPRLKQDWYDGDSVLAQYQPFCQGIYQCRSFLELKQAISSIF